MSDWEVVNDVPEPMQSASQSSDWSVAPFEDNQESAWTRIPRDALIGLTHAGRNLHNLPHDIAASVDYLGSKIGGMLGAPEFQGGQTSNLAGYFPYDTQNYADVLGQKNPSTVMDALVQKGVEYAPDVLGGINALRSLKLLPYLTKRGASKKLRMAKELSQSRDIGPMSVNPELIEDTRQFLPNDLYHRTLIDAAKTGDYQKLFDLQSNLGKASQARSGKLRALFSPESAIKGRAGFESQNALLKDIYSALAEQGNADISKLLMEGRQDFKGYKKFIPYRNALVGAGLAATFPKNALIDLGKKFWLHNNQ